MNVSTDPSADPCRRHMLRGIGLLGRGDFGEALTHFDEAIRLREARPWRDDPAAAWLLAAAWINRSDALVGLGDPALSEEAIVSLDRGIEAMSCVPLEEHPAFVDRLILAWIKRGSACGEAGDFTAARAGFAEAQRLLEGWGEAVTSERCLLAAALRANRARVALNGGNVAEGWEQASEAVARFRALEAAGWPDPAGVRARGQLCRALAMLLDEPGGATRPADWIAEATDAAEEALSLARTTGATERWVSDLVRYAARIYRVCQPQFLGPFLTEWLGPGGVFADDERLRREMANEIAAARADLAQRVRRHPQDADALARSMSLLRSLQAGDPGKGPA